eukprot:3848645-Amphidinium_carterae.1
MLLRWALWRGRNARAAGLKLCINDSKRLGSTSRVQVQKEPALGSGIVAAAAGAACVWWQVL